MSDVSLVWVTSQSLRSEITSCRESAPRYTVARMSLLLEAASAINLHETLTQGVV